MVQDSNDVWGTIKAGLGVVRDIQLAKQQTKIATTAAPSGSLAYSPFNPFPGQWGAYPQAEAKPTPGVAPGMPFNFAPVAIIIGAIVVVLALVGFGRR